MAEPDNLVLQHLRAIRETQDNHTDRLLELTQCVGNLEVPVSNLSVQLANLSVRVDRIDARRERVERRLGLIEA
jgi:hypothetical protein